MTEKPGVEDHQVPQRQWPIEKIERALWEIAAQGGSCTKAWRVLTDEGMEHNGQPITRNTLQYWKLKSHRNRYHEIKQGGVQQLEELIAMAATERAIQLGEAEDRAIGQVLAGLTGANGVEASQILRNLSASKQVQEQTIRGIRGRASEESVARSLEDVVKELRRIAPGVVTVTAEEPVVDAEVVAEAEAIEAGFAD